MVLLPYLCYAICSAWTTNGPSFSGLPSLDPFQIPPFLGSLLEAFEEGLKLHPGGIQEDRWHMPGGIREDFMEVVSVGLKEEEKTAR